MRHLVLLLLIWVATVTAKSFVAVKSPTAVWKTTNTNEVEEWRDATVTSTILRIRGGEAVTIGKKRKQKLSFPFMVKAFFTSMVDPTYAGQVEVPKPTSKKGGKIKGKKSKLGGEGPFGAAGMTGGASFGPVCGPNGCH
jgi:hypothetical protein